MCDAVFLCVLCGCSSYAASKSGTTDTKEHRGTTRGRHAFGGLRSDQRFCNSASNFGSMFPPLITATLIFVLGSSSAWKGNAAGATAPLGSAMVFAFPLRARMG